MKARLRLIASVEKGCCLPFDTQIAQEADFLSKGRSDFLATGLSMRRMMISEKELLPFDTQIAQEAVLMSKGRTDFQATGHTAHRRLIRE